MKKDVRLILGSTSDKTNGNIVLEIWKQLGISYQVSYASCHRQAGEEFHNFLDNIEEKVIVFLGGMSLAAPGEIISYYRNKENFIFDKLVFGIPTDSAALSAIQDLPAGTPVLTCGLNQISLKATLTNSALAVAHLIASREVEVRKSLSEWYGLMSEKKPLVEEVKLEDGLIVD